MWFQIPNFPDCVHHLFFSHSREDSQSLVVPVRDRLMQFGVTSWLDLHHYPYGTTPVSALRDSMLLCRHVVFFVTSAVLDSPRGWCCVEYTLGKIIQDNFERYPTLIHFLLPLFFVARDDARINRSVWNDLRGIGKFVDDPTHADLNINWAVQAVYKFLKQEQLFTDNKMNAIVGLPELQRRLPEIGLIERATRFHPSRLRID